MFLSNGPGDPAAVAGATETGPRACSAQVPVFGICLGHQILAQALGASTYKLPFGHHGGNHPVRRLATGTVEITSQNHNYAVVPGTFEAAVETSHVNLNDGVIEGFVCRDVPAFSVQYHPEAGPGPHDARYLFGEFADLMRRCGGAASAGVLDERWDAAENAQIGRSASAQGARQGRRGHQLPRREDIQSVLVIGSGPIVIGQACEFDYSGTQACRALSAEGYRVVLVNSNPATIMTDPEIAHRTYIEPLVPEILEAVIARERPDALLPTLGGQTGLNLAMKLHETGCAASATAWR